MNDACRQPEKPELPTLSSSFLGNLQRKDPASWNRLVMTFSPIVYRWCRRSGIREADSADIVQDVFSTVARGIEDFERQHASGSFRAWLATITRSRVRDFMRKNARHQVPVGGTDALKQLQSVPDGTLAIDGLNATICYEDIESPIAQRIMDLVKTEFEDTTWQAFWLTTIEGWSPATAANQLNLSLASVYQARTRVLRKLRQRISELPV